MFDMYDHNVADKPCVEFDEAEAELAKMELPAGGWRFGARRVGPVWRTMLRVDTLPHDIMLPGDHPSQEQALAEATRLSVEFGGVPYVPAGEA